MFVLPEELIHQSVPAQMVNTLTNKTFAETVTLNVKLAILTTLVLNVLTTLKDTPQKNVHVTMDTMRLVMLFVHLVTTNVPLVLPMNNVSLVPTQESTHLNVIAQNICMMMPVSVPTVHTNVKDVTPTQLIVKNVLPTESTPQLVTVQPCITMTESTPNVQNVTVVATLVTALDV